MPVRDPRRRGRVREVDDRALRVVGRDRGLAVGRAREEPARLALGVHRALPRQVGILPQREPHAAVAEPVDESAGFGERLLVPLVIARVEHARGATAEPERIEVDDIEWQVAPPHALDHGFHLGAVPVHAA